jgi:hypothetical protein
MAAALEELPQGSRARGAHSPHKLEAALAGAGAGAGAAAAAAQPGQPLPAAEGAGSVLPAGVSRATLARFLQVDLGEAAGGGGGGSSGGGLAARMASVAEPLYLRGIGR